MFPSVLSEVCAIVGVALLSLAFGAIYYYKEKVQKLVSDETSKLLVTEEISEFTKKIMSKDVDFKMVTDFYDQFAEANEPTVFLKRSWRFFVISGVLFIVAGVTGCIDFALFDLISWEALLLGFVALTFALYYVMKLENRF